MFFGLDPIPVAVIGGLIAITPVITLIIFLRYSRRGGRDEIFPRVVAIVALAGVVIIAVTTIVIVLLALIQDTFTIDVPLFVNAEVPSRDEYVGQSSFTVGSGKGLRPVTVSGAPAAALWSFIAAKLLFGAVLVALLLLVASFARATLELAPFTSSLRRGIFAAGLLVGCGLTAAQVLNSIAASIVREDFYTVEAPPGIEITRVFSWTAFNIDFVPLGVGIILIVASRLIRSGERLQRDTEGLV